jgi:hypothetical protein
MTKDDIIRMAKEAGLFTHKEVQPEILAFYNLAAAHKAEVITAEAYRCGYKAGMEAAAVICENVDKSTHPADLAAAIRARGENT